MRPWVGVDLDGTLAQYNGWMGPDHIGPPVPKMVERIRHFLNVEKLDVRIFTARMAGDREGISPKVTKLLIQDWLERECGLPRLEVTNVKDFYMVELYDDRAVQVEFNTGEVIGRSTLEHRQLLKEADDAGN